jgi:outer membrane immunogenic protein
MPGPVRGYALETEMKKYLLGTAAAIAIAVATPAAAADMGARMPMKAPPPVVAVWTWTGFYVGINGGYGWGDSKWSLLPGGLNEGTHHTDGGTIGGQIGYNWQFGNWVVGLEAQGNWADFNGSNVSIVAPLATNRTKIDAFGLFTGKVGYAFNNVLVYATGGAAVQSVDYSWSSLGLVRGTADETRWGATVGAGLEYAFTPNVSAGVQYNHLFMGNKDVTFSPLPNASDRVRLDSDVFTARLNYRFGGPAVPAGLFLCLLSLSEYHLRCVGSVRKFALWMSCTTASF